MGSQPTAFALPRFVRGEKRHPRVPAPSPIEIVETVNVVDCL